MSNQEQQEEIILMRVREVLTSIRDELNSEIEEIKERILEVVRENNYTDLQKLDFQMQSLEVALLVVEQKIRATIQGSN